MPTRNKKKINFIKKSRMLQKIMHVHVGRSVHSLVTQKQFGWN